MARWDFPEFVKVCDGFHHAHANQFNDSSFYWRLICRYRFITCILKQTHISSWEECECGRNGRISNSWKLESILFAVSLQGGERRCFLSWWSEGGWSVWVLQRTRKDWNFSPSSILFHSQYAGPTSICKWEPSHLWCQALSFPADGFSGSLRQRELGKSCGVLQFPFFGIRSVENWW